MDTGDVQAAKRLIEGVRAAFAHDPKAPQAYVVQNEQEGWRIKSSRHPIDGRTTRVVVTCNKDDLVAACIRALNTSYSSNWKGDEVTFTVPSAL